MKKEMEKGLENIFMKVSDSVKQPFKASQNDGRQGMGKLAKPHGPYLTQGVLGSFTLGLVIAITPGIQGSSIDANMEPQFTEVRIVRLQVTTKPAQGVKIYYVPRNETSTFIY
jgi:hypothetical protein